MTTAQAYSYHSRSPLDDRSKQLRRNILNAMVAAGRGHLGPAFSVVEILRVLYDDILKFDARNPSWPLRDRCVLSKGHGCLALYVLLAEKGFFPTSELERFCRSDALLGGHPEIKIPGVEASTGSLGHGLSIGIGFALNEQYEKAGYRTFVIIGDGECNEGSVWEAALCAAKHKLERLCVIVDYNKMQSYGATRDVCDLEPFADKWRSFGFDVLEADGHDPRQLKEILENTSNGSVKPFCLIAHTIKGKGVPLSENNPAWHHKNRLSSHELEAFEAALGGRS